MKPIFPLALGVVAIALVLAVTVVGCTQKSESSPKAAGVAESTGAALDRAAEKTAEAAKTTAAAAKDVAGQAVEKTGEVLKKAGDAVEQTGADMQK